MSQLVYTELDSTDTLTTIHHTNEGFLISVREHDKHAAMGFVNPRDLVHALRHGGWLR